MPRNFFFTLFGTTTMCIARIALLPMIFVLTTALPSLGATASEQSCNFVNSFLDSKSKAIRALEETFGHSEQAFQTIVGSMNAIPNKFDDGQVVEVANVGNLFVEHFIVINKQDYGNIYFRIVYEKSGESMIGMKFVFNSDAENILEDWPMLENPVDINC